MASRRPVSQQSARTASPGATSRAPKQQSEIPASKQPEVSEKKFCQEVDDGSNRRAFFLMGLCNNFSYAVVMSAAVDIMRGQASGTTSSTFTAYIFVANIVPSLFAKIFGPFFFDRVPYASRVWLTVVFNFISLQLVSSNAPLIVKLGGICLSSFGHGVGEGSLLGLSSQYHPTIITALGTGFAGAGLSSSAGYLLLTSWLGLAPLDVLWGLSFVTAALHLYSYFVMLGDPIVTGEQAGSPKEKPKAKLSLQDKIRALQQIRPQLCVLFVEYLAHYLVMSGVLSSLTQFQHNPYTARDTYVRFMLLERVGNILSRYFPSAVGITNASLLASLQIANFAALAAHAYSPFMPTIYIAFASVFWVGLVTGTCYVHSFSGIRKCVVPASHTEFCMGIASTANECGITVASLIAIYLQDWLQQAQAS